MAKIILVEDNEELCEGLTTFLIMAEHQVVAVGTGVQYREKLAAESYELAIIDIGLPDVSGFTLAEETRHGYPTKVIILTALDSLDDRIRGYGSGGHIYLTKPVDNNELLAIIESLTRPDKPAHEESPESTADGESWLLDFSAWLLYDPLGTAVKLTGKERQFLKILLDADEDTVSRGKVLTELYPRDDAHTSRALDSLVRRLRKKIRENSGCDFPLNTSYAEGFCFGKPLKMMAS
jgi:DNA-binding response OmpR family regulator